MGWQKRSRHSIKQAGPPRITCVIMANSLSISHLQQEGEGYNAFLIWLARGLNEIMQVKCLAQGLALSGHPINGAYHCCKGESHRTANLDTREGHCRGSQPNMGEVGLSGFAGKNSKCFHFSSVTESNPLGSQTCCWCGLESEPKRPGNEMILPGGATCLVRAGAEQM